GSSFHRILWDSGKTAPDAEIKRVVLCSGKVYYDLYEEREKREITDVQILRVEQLYPFPHKPLKTELARFPGALRRGGDRLVRGRAEEHGPLDHGAARDRICHG